MTPPDIQLGEDRLKVLLAEFKLELIRELEKFATVEAHKALEKIVELLDARVKLLELWQANMTGSNTERRSVWDGAFKWVTLAVTALTAAATIVWLKHG